MSPHMLDLNERTNALAYFNASYKLPRQKVLKYSSWYNVFITLINVDTCHEIYKTLCIRKKLLTDTIIKILELFL